jgi:PhnB protein
MKVQSYLFFDGRCEEALAFYKKVLGAEETMLMRYKDNPEPQPGMQPQGAEDKVMHCSFKVGETEVLASDGNCLGKPNFQGFSLAVTVADEASAEKTFAALSEGGTVQMPMSPTFFAKRFGMVADKFGVGWMVLTES